MKKGPTNSCLKVLFSPRSKKGKTVEIGQITLYVANQFKNCQAATLVRHESKVKNHNNVNE
jgi:hypothetical protein